MRVALIVLFGLTLAPAPSAQPPPVVTDDPWCDGVYSWSGGAHHCEVREYTLPAPDQVTVNAGVNGGIDVEGWERGDVRLRARVVARAPSTAAARRLVESTRIETGPTVRPVIPDAHGENTSVVVNFELAVPRRATLDLTTVNGGIDLAGVAGRITFEAVNGGIGLDGVGGDIRGRTVNGGVSVALIGNTWDGRGLDVETTNGGVTVVVPEGYSAELETGSVNGPVHIGFPVGVEGDIARRLNTTLGRGGPRLRVVTTNGSVGVERGRHSRVH